MENKKTGEEVLLVEEKEESLNLGSKRGRAQVLISQANCLEEGCLQFFIKSFNIEESEEELLL